MVSGQAAGVMAALAARDHVSLHHLDAAEVRKVLRRQGAVLERDQPIAGNRPDLAAS